MNLRFRLAALSWLAPQAAPCDHDCQWLAGNQAENRVLLRGITAIDEDGLARHPPFLRHHQPDPRHDILNGRQAGFMVSLYLFALLPVKTGYPWVRGQWH